MATDSLFMSWLQDAYSMEQALIPALENHARDAQGHPLLRGKMREHLEATRRHADLVRGCIERLGGKVSARKSGAGSVLGTLQSLMSGAAQDDLVKNGLSDYAAEQFEIASYKALIAAAKVLGDNQTIAVCQQIQEEEEDMARFLDESLPYVIQEQVRREMAAQATGSRSAPPPRG